KDASSSSIYGSRAANGVILITSKRGLTDKPTIRVNAFVGLSDVASNLKLLSPERYLQRRLDWRTQVGLESNPADIASYLTNTEAENYLNGISHDTWELVYQQGKIASTDVSISGQTSNTNYYLSAALTDEHGLVFN